jgi:hypothetical protein
MNRFGKNPRFIRRGKPVFLFRGALKGPRASDPLLNFLLFIPGREERPLTDLERLGIWAARRAREGVEKGRGEDFGLYAARGI